MDRARDPIRVIDSKQPGPARPAHGEAAHCEIVRPVSGGPPAVFQGQGGPVPSQAGVEPMRRCLPPRVRYRTALSQVSLGLSLLYLGTTANAQDQPAAAPSPAGAA